MKEITGVGIDISKGYIMIAVRQPGGVTLLAPFRVNHTASKLQSLVQRIRTLPSEVRIVMEHTGSYWRPIALTLVKAGFFVSVVNAMLIHDFRDNSLRRGKTDKADALKIANYALAFWQELHPYTAEDETRQLLKMQCLLYERTLASSVAHRNGLISLLDQVFPGVNRIFYQMVRADNGQVKWVDFVRTYWHKECVSARRSALFSLTLLSNSRPLRPQEQSSMTTSFYDVTALPSILRLGPPIRASSEFLLRRSCPRVLDKALAR